MFFKECGNSHSTGRALHTAQPFKVSEKEALVADDRATDGTTKLVLTKLRLRTCGGKVIARIKLVVTQEFVHRAVETICARLCQNIDDCGGRAAHLGGVLVRLDAELLNCVNRWPDANGADNALIVVEAVDLLRVDHRALAVHGDCRGFAAIVRARAAGDGVSCTRIGTRYELCEVDKVATVCRQILNSMLADGSANC